MKSQKKMLDKEVRDFLKELKRQEFWPDLSAILKKGLKYD